MYTSSLLTDILLTTSLPRLCSILKNFINW